MIYKNIEFFNVVELQKEDEIPGYKLQRFPESVRNQLGNGDIIFGRYVAEWATGCEIRFVSEGSRVSIFLSAIKSDGEVCVFKGGFFHSRHSLKAGIIKEIHLEEPQKLSQMDPEILRGFPFSSKVWRIVIGNKFNVKFNGINSYGCNIRVPEKDEVPALKWMAYGSSITQGSGAQQNHCSYIQQAARRLKVDVLNKGLGGSCLCEKAVADYIATQSEWDFITLELGVNMRSGFTPEEFEHATEYLIRTVLENNPGKPVILITIFPNFAQFSQIRENVLTVRDYDFCEILRKLYLRMKNPHLYLIEGREVLSDLTGVTCDLIHPSDFGHILMGEQLAARLKEILNI